MLYELQSFVPINSDEEFEDGLEEYLKYYNSNPDATEKMGKVFDLLVTKNDFSSYKLNIIYTTLTGISGEDSGRFFYQVIRYGFRDVSLFPIEVINKLVPIYAKYNQLLVCAEIYATDPAGFAGVEVVSTNENNAILRFVRADTETLTATFGIGSMLVLTEMLLDRMIDNLHLNDQFISAKVHSGLVISLDRIMQLVGDRLEPDEED